MKRTLAVLAFFVAALLAGLFVNASFLNASPTTKEHFLQKDVGHPLEMQTSDVSGVAAASPLLGFEPKDVSAKPYELADEGIYQFSSNKVGADCCPSVISGDLGCVCLTEQQRSDMASRYGNRST